ncbi:DNA ligase [Vibrio coralliilyticus]|uniref:DNA ligase n=1 Tax=Vibrio coralliilyticus TaxID=190893 RepID=UPI000BAAD82D|nr:DNA ligase [Vibrio coralliilyticus]NOI57495.1 DNA ligase [Vibrio coralliilyticus]PAT67944.1 DNA ligase [Vibrio coralliilyticus]
MQIKLTSVAIAVAISCNAWSESHSLSYMPLVQANDYEYGTNIEDYWKSEKLDGIRAIWDGSKLTTRNGKVIHAPDWFIKPLPSYAVEGELWAGRGKFHIVQQTVLDKVPVEPSWKQIDFMLFDMPQAAGDYQKRYYNIRYLVDSIDAPHIKLVEHTPIRSEQELFHYLDNVSEQKGEGLMLRKVTSRYQAGRSSDLLKMKKHQDAEGLVVGYKVGKGKYSGQMGALLIQLDSGIEFYIGSGFTDEQRRQPPKLGSIITFRYNGYTQNGIPKFARYMREKPEYTSE